MSTAAQRTRLVAASRIAAKPAKRGAPAARPPLEVVAPRQRRVRHRRVAPLLSAAIVSLSLLLVVVGHAELAQGQVRLADMQTQITAARLAHQREVLALANLENPSRILRVAEGTLHMASPDQVRQLAHVPLGTAVPLPKVAPPASTSSTRSAAPSG